MSPAPRRRTRRSEDYAPLSGKVTSPVPSKVYATALTLLKAAAEALSNPVSNAYVAPGSEVAWDECCAGHLYVKVAEVTPVFGPRAADGAACYVKTWNVTYIIGTLRCVEVVDDRGRGPRALDLTSDAEILTQDMADLGMMLTSTTNADNLDWQAQGPDGGCVAGEWSFTLNLRCP